MLSFGTWSDIWGQSDVSESDLVCLDAEQSRKALRCFKELELKDQKILLLEQKIVNLQKEKELSERELDIQKRFTEIAERKAEVEHTAYLRQIEVTEQYKKLVEVGKPSSNFQLMGLLGIAAFALGLLVK